jgi:NhaD family Na+/H+ antiporter
MILNQINTLPAVIALFMFVLAYIFVILEEFIHLRKSKPVVLAAGIIWVIVALLAKNNNMQEVAHQAIKNNILEYAELLLFLLVAMTYVNAMQERKVFEALKDWLVARGLSFRQLFWATGILAFFISPVTDNLTTALILCAVILAVGKDNKNFISLSCINIVVAANAGGAYSPFGDITTLMVWQENILKFSQFFKVFVPALVSFLIPAACMHFALVNTKPKSVHNHIPVKMSLGAKRMIMLFMLTIITAVCFHNFLHLPAAIGMMTGLGYLKLLGYYIKLKETKLKSSSAHLSNLVPFDIIEKIEGIEWDTLLFFYGVMLCVGGLATIGYLEILSNAMYHSWGASLPAIHHQTPANIMIGLLSAIIDNIPVMYAVITMRPEMSEGQWLLVTLTAGIGGSLLSIGSAAGVALMGQAKKHYTFFSHLKWTWAILIGYFVGIWVHFLVNKGTF